MSAERQENEKGKGGEKTAMGGSRVRHLNLQKSVLVLSPGDLGTIRGETNT